MAMNQSTLVLLLFAVVTLILLYLYNRIALRLARRKFKLEHGCQPCPAAPLKDPILGIDMLLDNIRRAREHRLLETLDYRLNTYGTTYSSKRLGTPAITTMEPENVKAILATSFKDYAIAPFRMPALGFFLGSGIFTTDGPHWASSRAMIRPNFVREQVADLAAFEMHMQDLFAAIPADGSTVDLQDLFFRFTIDSATEFLFGKSVRSLRKELSDSSREGRFAKAFTVVQAESLKLLRLGVLRHLVWRREEVQGEPAVKVVHDYVDQFVDEAVRYREALDKGEEKEREEEENGEGRKYVFLHELAKHTKDKRRLRDELLNVLLAGRDTTASLLGNMFFVIAKRPDVWRKLQEEVASLDGKPPSYEQLRNLKYVKYCLNESLRLHPVVPANSRSTVRDTVLPVGGGPDGRSPIFVAKGTVVSYVVWAMHRRRDLFGPDAAAFRPERWEALRPGWEYLPFNGGPRICVGQQYALTEAAYVTVRMLQRFEGVESRDPGEWEELNTLTLCSRNGARVGLVVRGKEEEGKGL